MVEVNNIFHQSMAPVEHKEYFYQWPYAVFGDTFDNVLILGAGSGTDVAAALRHGARHVDAVEIDPRIIRIGRQRHPDHPYSDPRVTVINDDARHFLRTTRNKYDLVVFALIDSLTMQSTFSGVRLESYMFTEESFRAVRDHLSANGVLVIYNYFRERWLVDRLANTAAAAFGEEPHVHVHEARAYLGVLMAGPRLKTLTHEPEVPDQVTAYGQSHDPSPARTLRRDPSIEPATDDWPFLYMKDRELPRHYLNALAVVLVISLVAVHGDPPRRAGPLLVALLPARRRLHAAGNEIDHPVCVIVGLDVDRGVALDRRGADHGARRQLRSSRASTPCGPGSWAASCVALLAISYAVPIGRITFESRVTESIFYSVLVFSPVLCAGLLFGSAIKRSTSLPRDYGTNLLGAMVGGVAEDPSLVTGFNALLVIIALCYIGAVMVRKREFAPSVVRV